MRRPFAALALVASVLLSACTFVPTDSGPQSIAKHDVPFGLLAKTLPPIPKGPTVYVTRSISLINGNQLLTERPRRVPKTNSVAVSLEALFAGPTDHESTLGFTSEVPATWHVIGIGTVSGALYIRLGAPITPATPASALMSGQLILTSARLPNQPIEFLVNNQALQLTLPGGTISLQARAIDYVSLEAL